MMEDKGDMALPGGTGPREPSPSVSAVPASVPNAVREELSSLGYRVIDATNQYVASGWAAYPPGDPTYVGITATEDEAWQWAAEHAGIGGGGEG